MDSSVYMIFLMYIQNLAIIGPVLSEIMRLIKIDTDDRQSDGKGRPLFGYSRGHETSRKYESGNCPIELITIVS